MVVMKNKSQLLDFWYLFIGYAVVFTNNIYFFIFLFTILIAKFVYILKSCILIIVQLNSQIAQFQSLEFHEQRNTKLVLLFTYATLVLSLAFIVAIVIYRFDFWSSYIFK